MTEENTTREERAKRQKRHDDAGLCHVGSAMDGPCQREATEKRWPGEEEPSLCPEHLVCFELGDEVDHWQEALDKIEGWIRGPVEESFNDDLQRLAYDMRDEARRAYARATIEADAARRVADSEAGPDDASISLEEELELTRRIVHADALANARTILEDMSEGILQTVVKTVDKWLVVDALDTAADKASEEVERFKRGRKL